MNHGVQIALSVVCIRISKRFNRNRVGMILLRHILLIAFSLQIPEGTYLIRLLSLTMCIVRQVFLEILKQKLQNLQILSTKCFTDSEHVKQQSDLISNACLKNQNESYFHCMRLSLILMMNYCWLLLSTFLSLLSRNEPIQRTQMFTRHTILQSVQQQYLFLRTSPSTDPELFVHLYVIHIWTVCAF